MQKTKEQKQSSPRMPDSKTSPPGMAPDQAHAAKRTVGRDEGREGAREETFDNSRNNASHQTHRQA